MFGGGGDRAAGNIFCYASFFEISSSMVLEPTEVSDSVEIAADLLTEVELE